MNEVINSCVLKYEVTNSYVLMNEIINYCVLIYKVTNSYVLINYIINSCIAKVKAHKLTLLNYALQRLSCVPQLIKILK